VKIPPYFSSFSSASRMVFEALEKRSTLAWPILKKQCEIVKLDPANLKLADLKKVVPGISQALSSFTTPTAGRDFQQELLGASKIRRRRNTDITDRMFRATVELNSLSSRAMEILREVTPLAWPVLESHCARANFNPSTLTADELKQLVDKIEIRIASLSNRTKGVIVREKLLALIEETAEDTCRA
jgi:hypothetical protein